MFWITYTIGFCLFAVALISLFGIIFYSVQEARTKDEKKKQALVDRTIPYIIAGVVSIALMCLLSLTEYFINYFVGM